MTKIVDARGLSCPQPVLMTLDEINTGESSPLEVLVDTETAMENVSRAARSRGWSVSGILESGEDYRITIAKDKGDTN
jgi:TusA-related sulfurtransferase